MLHINSVVVGKYWYHYNLRNEQVVLSFVHNGNLVGEIHNIKIDKDGYIWGVSSTVQAISCLLDDDIAKRVAEETIKECSVGTNNMFSLYEKKLINLQD